MSRYPAFLARFLTVLLLWTFVSLPHNVYATQVDDARGQELADKVASIATVGIYNLDTDQLAAVLENFLFDHPEIIGLKIFESIENERLLSFYREENGDITYGKDIPEGIASLEPFKATTIFEGEEIGTISLYYRPPNPFNLTTSELQWLVQNPVVRVGVDEVYPPFEFVDENGHYQGMAKEYLDVLAPLLGVKFERVKGLPWAEVVEQLKAGNLDIAPVMTNTPERRKFALLTHDYLDFPIAIITRNSTQNITSLKDMEGKTVAIPRGYSDLEEIPAKQSGVNIKIVETPVDALREVASGNADAAHGNIAVLSFLIQKHSLINLKVAGISELKSGSHAMAVRKDWPIFHAILSKALGQLDQSVHQRIRTKWLMVQMDLNEFSMSKKITLSAEERMWINANPEISVGIEEWYPFVRAENTGEAGGIAGDFMNLVMAKTGLKMNIVPDEWATLLSDFEKGKIDLLPATYYTDERATYGRYSNPYFSAKEFLYVLENNTDIRSFEDLRGKKLAIPEDFGTIPKVREKFPDIEIVETKNQLASIYAVLNGEVDATFESQIVMEDLIRKELISGVKAVGQTAFKASPLYFFSHKDKPLLQAILTKALDSITEAERSVILNKWIVASSVQQTVDLPQMEQLKQDSFILKYIGIFFVILVGLLVGLWFYRGRPTQLLISDRLFLVSFVFVGLIVSIGTLVTMLLDRGDEQAELENRKYEILQLAQELKQSSDDLTRVARAYAQDGEARYEQYFRTILQIRDGEIPHPKNYHRSYWDHLLANKIEFKTDGDTYSVEKRMNNLGLSAAEIALLQKAKEDSDALVHIEDTAFNALKGIFRDEYGNFTRSGPPDDKLARRLLYGPQYYKAKSQIMESIDRFFTLLELRMANELNSIRIQTQAILVSITVLTFITIIFSIYAFVVLRQRVVQPLRLFESGAKTIAGGDYSQSIQISTEDEFGALAVVFNKMSEAIEENTRELNFQKFAMDRHAIVCATDHKGCITYVNDRFLKVTGFTRDELLGLNMNELHSHSEHGEAYFKDLWATISDGNVWHGEFCNQAKNGSPVWLAATIVPFVDDEGKPERYISISTDITFRKESEALIQDREKRLQSIINNAVDGIIIIDRFGIIQSFSPAAERIFGYKEVEVIERNIKMLMPDETAIQHDGFLSDFLNGKTRNVVGNNREVEGMRKDGSTFPMDLAVGVSTINEETIFTGIVRDITIRKEVEAAIERSEERTRLILASIGEGVFGVDLEGRITFVNPQVETMLGYTQRELLGKKAHSLFHYKRADGSHYPVEDCWMYKSFTQGYKFRIDNEVLWRKDGTPLQIEYYSTPIMKDEEILGAVISFSDITIRKEAETKLQDAYDIISSSITYASQIQQSALPDHTVLQPLLQDYFLWWEPRDVVGGDLYWVGPWGDGCLIILGDCTGHGVPGAFMTLISIAALERAMHEIPGGEVGRLISRTHQYIQTMLGQHYEGGATDDGIELGACYFVPFENQMTFAGARFDLMMTNEDGFEIIKGTKAGMGYRKIDYMQQYEEKVIDITPERQFYMASDGASDQVGGPRNRMYGRKKLLRYLFAHRHLNMADQKKLLTEEILRHQGDHKRRDDISVIGFRFMDEDET